MSVSRLLFLGGNRPWLEILDGAIVRRGDGHDPSDMREGETLIAIAPAADVVMHWLELPDLSMPQANAAARLHLADRALGDTHVVSGLPDEEGVRPVAMVAAERMAAWIDELDPDIIIPAQMMVASPAEGFVRAGLGPETVVRGHRAAFADDLALTPLLTENEDIVSLDREAIEMSVLATILVPPLDLRQGVFARRTRWLPDMATLRPLFWMAAALALVTLAIPLAKIARLSFDTSHLQNETAEVARLAVGEAVAADEAAALLDTRLSALRGGGGGFAGTAAATISSVSATPNVELASLAFAPDGVMRLSARATSQAELDAFTGKLRGAGLEVIPGISGVMQGRPTMELQVRAR